VFNRAVKIPYFGVDAFTSRRFSGNPAGVCLLGEWLPDRILQDIAMENNLSETAFLVPADQKGEWDLRWFTPALEVDLCGHATLASAFVLKLTEQISSSVQFHSKSGRLEVHCQGDLLVLDFPSRPPQPISLPEPLAAGLQCRPKEILKARDYLAVFETEEEVAAVKPNFDALLQLD